MDGAHLHGSRPAPYYLAHLIAALVQVRDRERPTFTPPPPIAHEPSPTSIVLAHPNFAFDVGGMSWINPAPAILA